jgi:hypothetical protein
LPFARVQRLVVALTDLELAVDPAAPCDDVPEELADAAA